jgi:hypothetical protein
MRPFSPIPTGRIPLPNWLDTPSGSSFLRGFGLLQRRPRGGSRDWAGEDNFAGCRGALRFTGPLGEAKGLPGRPAFALRRFFSDGRSVARVEVNVGLVPDGFSLDARDVLRSLTRLPVRVPGGLSGREIQLADVGPHLAAHLLRSTTAATPRPTPWWIEAGRPLTLVEYDEGDIGFGRPSIAIDAGEGLVVRPAVYRGRGAELRAWMIAARAWAPEAPAREIRISLIRYHVERECLRLVLRRIERGDLGIEARSEPTDELQHFLFERIKLLRRDVLNGIDMSPYRQFALAHGDLVEDQSGITVLSRLRTVRRAVRRSVEEQVMADRSQAVVPPIIIEEVRVEYRAINIGANASINAPVVIADTVEQSFNQVQASVAPPDLKEALAELHRQFVALAEQLPPDEADLAARDLTDLSREATSSQPRMAFLRRAAEGLLSAARQVAEIGTPIAALVEKVMSLLA